MPWLIFFIVIALVLTSDDDKGRSRKEQLKEFRPTVDEGYTFFILLMFGTALAVWVIATQRYGGVPTPIPYNPDYAPVLPSNNPPYYPPN